MSGSVPQSSQRTCPFLSKDRHYSLYSAMRKGAINAIAEKVEIDYLNNNQLDRRFDKVKELTRDHLGRLLMAGVGLDEIDRGYYPWGRPLYKGEKPKGRGDGRIHELEIYRTTHDLAKRFHPTATKLIQEYKKRLGGERGALIREYSCLGLKYWYPPCSKMLEDSMRTYVQRAVNLEPDNEIASFRVRDFVVVE